MDMTGMKRTTLCLSLNGLVLFASGQIVVTTAGEESIMWLPQVMYRPFITDSTLLMLSPDLVWRCELKDFWGGGTYFEVDLEHVISCEGRKEVYELVRGYGECYIYQPISRTLRARLTRTSESSFLCTELATDDTTSVVRSIPLKVDLSGKPAYIDSSYTEDIQSGNMRLTISKMIELKVSP